MNLLTRNILKGYLKIFFLIEIVLIWIFLVVDYLNNLDKFVEAGLSAVRGILFVCLKIPFVIVHLTPVSIVLTSVIFFGLMNKNNEVIALCSSGISLKKIYIPIILLSFVLSFFVFYVSDTIMPATSSKLNYMSLTEIKKKKILTRKKNNIWLKDHNSIIYIDHFNASKNEINNITINEFNKNNELIVRTDAKSGVYRDGTWTLKNIFYTKDLDKEYGQNIKEIDVLKKSFNFSPSELKEAVKMPEEMSLFELKKYIKQLREKGYDYRKYIVDFYTKTAFPFVCVIMAAIGSLIGLKSSLGKKIPLGIGISLFLSLLYWSFYSFTVSLGYGEAVHPFIAAWSANIIFGIATFLSFIFFERNLIQS